MVEAAARAVFGDGTYHTEDTFSAMPDIAQDGKTAEEKDNLQTFASKADPPYYSITQGLSFIIRWCTEFRGYGVDKKVLNLITSAHRRIEKDMISEPLKKLEGTDEEKDFVLVHEKLLSRIELIDEPRENLVGRDLRKEIDLAVAELKAASQAYLLRMQTDYAQAKAEFEQFMGINPDDELIKKRSVTMGFHTMAHALGGNKGVVKVGEYHLVDFEHMDLGDVTLSGDGELQEFLRKKEEARTLLLKSVDQADSGGVNETAPIQQKTDSNGLPANLKAGVENLSGYSMDDVKVHYNSSEPAQLNAHAYAQGTDIHVAPGQEKHLPHEAWHVVQQKQGRVQPTIQAKDGIGINDSVGLEQEADTMGQRATQLMQSVSESLKNGPVSRVAVQRMPNPRQPVQLLSDFEAVEWKSQLDERDDLRAFPAFANIVLAADKWDGMADDENAEALSEEINKLGELMLSDNSDITKVYEAIKKYFPEEYLSIKDVAMAKKYNFDGPVAFTGENVMAWLRLANGRGTVDDLRYIHHEMYEIKKIQGTEFAPDLVKTEPSENFWDQAYPPAHGAALMVEIRFLMHAVNLIYKKNYTWEHVAASDIERREDFLGTLYGKAKVPLGKDYLPDMKKVKKDFGKFIDPELSGLLTELKKKKLGG